MGRELSQGGRVRGYTIQGPLGAGGFAITYLATKGNHEVVLKELYPDGLVERDVAGNVILSAAARGSDRVEAEESWENARENFWSEATALANLECDTIPRLYNLFEANGTFYIAQEFIKGESLDDAFDRLDDDRRPQMAIVWLLSILRTLEVVHSQILHRDLKPNNILVREDDLTPILIDFGGARFQTRGVSYNYGRRVWSPGYSSPEQVLVDLEQEQTASSDLYSLAATFYRLLFGEAPVDARDRWQHDTARSFVELAQEYPKELLRSLDRAYRLDFRDRYGSAAQWRADLECPEDHWEAHSYDDPRIDSYSWFVGSWPAYATVVVGEGNPYVSSRHLHISRIGNGYLIKDISSNGTLIRTRHTRGEFDRMHSPAFVLESDVCHTELSLAEQVTVRLDHLLPRLVPSSVRNASGHNLDPDQGQQTSAHQPQPPALHHSHSGDALSWRSALSWSGSIGRLLWWEIQGALFTVGVVSAAIGWWTRLSYGLESSAMTAVSLCNVVAALPASWVYCGAVVRRLRDLGMRNNVVPIFMVGLLVLYFLGAAGAVSQDRAFAIISVLAVLSILALWFALGLMPGKQ